MAASIEDLSLITEEYPPYNYMSSGKLKGISVDMLIGAYRHLGKELLADDIKLQPWPRGYRSAKMGPNVLLFSMTRNKNREALFQWVGPITKTKIVLLAKKSRKFVLNDISDAGQLLIGGIRDDIGLLLAAEQGVPQKHLKVSASANYLARLLALDRIDLWAYEENAAFLFLKRNGLNPNDYHSVYTLSESELFYALSLDTDLKVVRDLQQAVDQFKGCVSCLQSIFSRYLK